MKFSRSGWPNGDTPTKYTHKKLKQSVKKFPTHQELIIGALISIPKLCSAIWAQKVYSIQMKLSSKLIAIINSPPKKEPNDGCGVRQKKRKSSVFEVQTVTHWHKSWKEKREKATVNKTQLTWKIHSNSVCWLLVSSIYGLAKKVKRGEKTSAIKKTHKKKSWMKMTKQFHLFFVGCPQPPTSIVARTLNRVIFTRPQPAEWSTSKLKHCVCARELNL